jgi:hypothetical protein
VDKEYAAQLLEDTKTLVMAQRQAALGEMAVNKAEQTIKASPGWWDYVVSIVDARRDANLAKVRAEHKKMRFYENQSREANVRAEMKL